MFQNPKVNPSGTIILYHDDAPLGYTLWNSTELTLSRRHQRDSLSPMRTPAPGALALAAILLPACSYRPDALPGCFSRIDPSLRAVKQVMASGAYRGGDVELQHSFCSTHDDRLDVAEKLLSASGWSFERHIAELGHCMYVRVRSPLTPEALQRQVTAFCGIAAGARVAYSNWSSLIGDRFLYVSGNYVSFDRLGHPSKPT